MGTDFFVWPLRFHFIAAESIYFPEGKATNTIRGAFGSTFRKLVCAPECPGARLCEIVHYCPYASIFEPRSKPGILRPDRLADRPRPFVLRANQLDGLQVGRGEHFHFDLNLFVDPTQLLPYLVLTFRELINEGLGPSRTSSMLSAVESLTDGAPVYEDGDWKTTGIESIRFDLTEPSESVDRIEVHFLTPTELKSEGAVTGRLEFGLLFRRLRDRILNLRALYQGGPLEIDFEEITRRADQIRIARSDILRIRVQRLSSRTGQRHPVGGFTGEVEYQGNLSEFSPYFQIGEWVGVGRQTTFGKGRLAVHAGSAASVLK